MSRRQFFTFSLFLVLFALLIPPPQMGINAQEPPPEPISSPVPEEQPDMAYQPPADADELDDFLPLEGEVVIAPPAQPVTGTGSVTPTVPLSLTTPITAATAVTLTEPITKLVSFEEGKIAVVFEESTLTDTAKIELTTLPLPQNPLSATNTISNPLQSLVLQKFQLEVVQEGEVVAAEFSKPVRLVVDLRTMMQSLDPSYQSWDYFLAYQDESDPNVWIEVPIDLYQSDGLLSAEVTHFSDWAAGVRPERWNPTWTPPAVSTFSGAATYSHPIELPPGRHGLQPAISLSYSSRALDGRIQDGESGPIADGWSVGDISVVRVGVKLSGDGANKFTFHPDKFRLVFGGTGYEIFPAAGSNTTTDATVRYYVKDAPGYYLERNYSVSTPNTDGIYWILITPDGTRYRMGYFQDSEEWQRTGQYNLNVSGHPGHPAGGTEWSAIAWHVDTVTDSFGNQMSYHYHTRDTEETIQWWETDDWESFNQTTRSVRISEIKYNYPDRVTSLPAVDTVARLTSTPATRITFRSASIANDDDAFLINSIFIYHGSGSNPIGEYRINSQSLLVDSPGCLNYDAPSPYPPRQNKTRIVNSIQHWVNTDGDATTSDPGGYALPATTFSHTYQRHFTRNNAACFQFYYMTGYQNGYGGSVTFAYTSDNRSVDQYQYHSYGQYDWPQIGFNYSVSSMSIDDGPNPPTQTTYTYEKPCYDQWQTPPSGAVICPSPGAYPDSEYGNITGYVTTTVTFKGYSGEILNKQKSVFSQNAANTIGRVISSELQNASGIPLTRTENDYASLIYANSGGSNNDDVTFNTTSETRSYQYNNGIGSPTLSSKTRYEYDAAKQGGTQYGNLTHIRSYDDAADDNASPYNTTIRWYYPRAELDSNGLLTGHWAVGLMGGQAVYEGNIATLLNGVWSYYDNAANNTTPPTQGALTRSSSYIPVATLCSDVPGGGGNGCVDGRVRQTIDTTFAYDVYGNQTSMTSYSDNDVESDADHDYGYRTFNSSWGEAGNVLPSVGNGRTTTIAYDPTYNLYPIFTTFVPLNQTTNFQIYGFNGVAVDGFQKQPGLLKQVTGPDSVTVKYEYDPFGRLHAIYDANSTYQGDDFAGFGDTLPWNGDPVEQYRYWDNSWNSGTVYLNPAGNAPFVTTVLKRPGSFPAPANSSSGFAFADQTFYDGFGRPIQTRSLWHSVQGENLSREIISSTAYGANGQVSCQTAPYDVPFYADRGSPASPFVTDTCLSKPHTTTTYDALARPLTVTAPDGNDTTYAYHIVTSVTVDGRSVLARTAVTDANNHLQQQFSNSLGQLVLVREVDGDGSGGDPYVSDADTRYHYNVAGNLITVTQSIPSTGDPTTWLAQTTMSYDGYGRKTTMTDPDMGYWTYAYNAAGSLTKQVDAKGQAICFQYDPLNRLLTKAQDSTPSDACPTSLPTTGSYHLASYVYDTAVNGIGKLHQVSWGPNPSQNKDTFAYDSLGRMTGQTRLVDGRSYSMNYTGFDALHRPTVVFYPNLETVTMTYDREGENSLAAGGTTLVTNITYNALGQMRFLDRAGSIADTTYNYVTSGSSLYRLGHIQHGASFYSDNKPDFTYTYDPVGNINQIITWYKDENNANKSNTQNFSYDHLNRLLTATATGTAPNANYNHSYTYDKLGNMDFRVEDGDTLNYSYGSKPHAVTTVDDPDPGDPDWSLSYDANGNMTTRVDATGSYSQAFDVQNRLISVTKNSVTHTFAYDANGIRVKSSQPGQVIYTPFPGYEEEVRTPPTVDLTANGASSLMIGANQPFSLAWSSSEAASCTASGQWSGSKASSGSQTITAPANNGSYTYTLTCTNMAGSASDSVTVVVPFILTFTVNGNGSGATVDPATTFTLAWSTQGATSCTASGSWSGSKATSGSQNYSQATVGTYPYTLTCNGPNGSTNRTVTVYVTQNCPGGCGGGGDTHLLPETPAEGLAELPLMAKMNHLARPRLQSGGSTIIRTTYAIAGQTIATRVTGDPVSGNNGLFYIYSDHLGSSSVLVKSTAPTNIVDGSRTWYLPFGGYRPGSAPSQTITDRDFTGQRENMELGLLYYGARFYVPGLGRFASADTIVPNPANSQSYNRYSYVRNNPLNMTDPTGHYECDDSMGDCDGPTKQEPLPTLINFDGVDGQEWTPEEKAAVNSGAWLVAQMLFEAGGGQFSSPGEAFMSIYGGQVTFYKTGNDGCTETCYGEWIGKVRGVANTIYVYTDIYYKDDQGNFTTSKIPEAWAGAKWAVHELGHGFEAKVNTALNDANHIRDNLPANIANRDGFAGPHPGWQQSLCAIDCNGEIFADMFVGATYGQWEMDAGRFTPAAKLKSNYMTTNMSTWISAVSP